MNKRLLVFLITGMVCCPLLLTSCSGGTHDVVDSAEEQSYEAGYVAGYENGYDQGTSDSGVAEKEDALSAGGTIDTPYYTINFPESWKGTYEYTNRESTRQGEEIQMIQDLIVCQTVITNKVDGKVLFYVACVEETYPGVGNGAFDFDIGTPSSNPDYRIVLGKSILGNAGELELSYGDGFAFGADRKDEYINYIMIK